MLAAEHERQVSGYPGFAVALFRDQCQQCRLRGDFFRNRIERLFIFRIEIIQDVADVDTAVIAWIATVTRIAGFVSARNLVIEVEQVLHVTVLESRRNGENGATRRIFGRPGEVGGCRSRITRRRLDPLPMRDVAVGQVGTRGLVYRASRHRGSGQQQKSGCQRRASDFSIKTHCLNVVGRVIAGDELYARIARISTCRPSSC